MGNKLRELSKPVAWVTMQPEFCDEERTAITNKIEAEKYSLTCYDLTPTYSQEYVSALLAERDAFEGAALALRDELRASQAIANEYQQLMYHMDAGGDFFEFQRDKNNG